jgi:hypothetical protein
MAETNLPDSLDSAEDYKKASENFVMPLFYRQSKRIVEVIKKIHTAIKEDQDIKQEDINRYINEIKQLASFANKESTMNPYFQNLARLEQKLESEGYFDDPKPSKR